MVKLHTWKNMSTSKKTCRTNFRLMAANYAEWLYSCTAPEKYKTKTFDCKSINTDISLYAARSFLRSGEYLR
jgi:hypothetical protein